MFGYVFLRLISIG